MEGYSREGIRAFIGGCTELPMLFPYLEGNFEKYDPTLLLAQEVVGQAMAYARRPE
jgi:aspartate racemase